MSEQTREKLLAEIIDLRDEVAHLKSELEATEDELREATDKIEEHSGPTAIEAIDAFCDVVTRPTGQLVYTVPGTPEANRAILGLFDAINRTP